MVKLSLDKELRSSVIGLALVLSGILLISACSSAEKKEYAPMPEVPAQIDVQPAWVAPAGERSERAYRQLSSAVDSGTVYVANATGQIGALDMNTGKLLWLVDLHEKFSSGLGVGEGKLLISTNNAELIAMNQNDGKEVWRSQLSSIALSRPVIVKDKVIVQTNDEKLYALNANDGKRIWVESRDVPALTLRGTTTPLVIDDKVVSGFADGHLIAFDMLTGRTLWDALVAIPKGRTDLDRMVDIDGFFAYQDGLIYVSSYHGRIAAVAEKDGAIVWNRDMSSYSGVALDKNQLYVSDEDSFVWALDSKTGATLWRQENLKDRDISTPVVMDLGVAVADGGGYVHWLSKEDGSFIARENLKQLHYDAFVEYGDIDFSTLDYGVSVTPEVAGKHLLVRNNNGDLAMFVVQPKSSATAENHWYTPLLNLFQL